MSPTDISLAVVILLIMIMAFIMFAGRSRGCASHENLTPAPLTASTPISDILTIGHYLHLKYSMLPLYATVCSTQDSFPNYPYSEFGPTFTFQTFLSQLQAVQTKMISMAASLQANFEAAWSAASQQTKWYAVQVAQHLRNVLARQLNRLLVKLKGAQSPLPRTLRMRPEMIENILQGSPQNLDGVSALVGPDFLHNLTVVQNVPFGSLPDGPIKAALQQHVQNRIVQYNNSSHAPLSASFVPETYFDEIGVITASAVLALVVRNNFSLPGNTATQISAAVLPLNLPNLYAKVASALSSMQQDKTLSSMGGAI